MKFEKLKPGMLLYSPGVFLDWIVIKHKSPDNVIADWYCQEPYGMGPPAPAFAKGYNREFGKRHWRQLKTSRLATIKDAQNLIVALFIKGNN